ncbi:putative apoptosis-inducing factor 1, mitochondrial [Anabrus simplex]|uniref:putative apoptosis-inducing factor 1, mitochondrial n=1 Tax=Anabrus simplex TaxID=316456 RepID=UPI0035A2D08A
MCDAKSDKKPVCAIKTAQRIVYLNKKNPHSWESNPTSVPCPKKGRKRLKTTLIILLLTAICVWTCVEGYKILFPELQLTEADRERLRKKGIKKIIKVPRESIEIPVYVPYLLIGGGTASYFAARAILSRQPNAKILIISEEPQYPYLRPPLSKDLWTKDEVPERLQNEDIINRQIFFERNEFYTRCEDLMSNSNGGVAVAKGWKVTKLDPSTKTVQLDNHHTIEYEKCLLATGSVPNKLPAFENAPEEVKHKIVYYQRLDDFEYVHEAVKSGVKDIAIIGGGYLATELAHSLNRYAKRYGYKVHLIFRDRNLLEHTLPEYLSEFASNKLQEMGVNVKPRTTVERVRLKSEDDVVLNLSRGRPLTVQAVIVASGSKPNTQLAQCSGLEVDKYCGGFKANAELMARSSLWVAGDCASFFDKKYGRRTVQHAGNAILSGQVAGENMTGLGRPYSSLACFRSTMGPSLSYEGLGVIDSSLDTVSVFLSGKDKNPIVDISTCNKYIAAKNNYERGVIFYLFKNKVVGIILWNLPEKSRIAREVIKQEKSYEEINDVINLFLKPKTDVT